MSPSEDNAVLYSRRASYTVIILGMEADYMLQGRSLFSLSAGNGTIDFQQKWIKRSRMKFRKCVYNAILLERQGDGTDSRNTRANNTIKSIKMSQTQCPHFFLPVKGVSLCCANPGLFRISGLGVNDKFRANQIQLEEAYFKFLNDSSLSNHKAIWLQALYKKLNLDSNSIKGCRCKTKPT